MPEERARAREGVCERLCILDISAMQGEFSPLSRRKVATQRAQYLELVGSQAAEWLCAMQAEQHTRLAPACLQTAGFWVTSFEQVYQDGAPSVCSWASSSVHVLT